jgi:hypothetical protein
MNESDVDQLHRGNIAHSQNSETDIRVSGLEKYLFVNVANSYFLKSLRKRP